MSQSFPESTSPAARPAELPASRVIHFQIAREALRHMVAVRMREWFAARQAGADADTRADALAAEVTELAMQLRNLPASDTDTLRETTRRCSDRLKARGPRQPSGADHPPRRGRLSPTESAHIFHEFIWPSLCSPGVPQGQARAIVFGSHIGCGKARAIAAAAQELGGPQQVVTVMLEDLRAFHPRYAPLLQHNPRLAASDTEADMLRWVDMALEEAAAVRAPLILEAGMRRAEKIVDVFGFLEAAGYDVEARALAVPHAVSWRNIVVAQELSRQELGLTRTITAAAHQATFDGLPVMLEHIEQAHLAGRVTVFDRFGTCCYSHDVGTGEKSVPGPNAATALRIQRALPLTLQQLRQCHKAYRWLEDSISAPGRRIDNEELLQTEGLRWEAECAMLSEAFLTLPEPECLQEFPQLANAWDILNAIRRQSELLADEMQRTLWVKKAAAGIARRIADGNLALPLPW